MARPLRIEYPDAIDHMTGRWNARQAVVSAWISFVDRYGGNHSKRSDPTRNPIFIDGIGIDILDVVQPEPVGMEPEALKRDFSERIVFCGMLSLQHTLSHGTPDDCRAEAEHRIRVIGKDGGYIFSPPNSFTIDTPIENILAAYEVVAGKALM